MLRRMTRPPLPIDAVHGDARHQDVRAAVFEVVPQPRATLGKRAFWRLVLWLASFPAGLRLLRRFAR
jgi:hypothetical protein